METLTERLAESRQLLKWTRRLLVLGLGAATWGLYVNPVDDAQIIAISALWCALVLTCIR
jgi:hypothetical protein